jgi:CubicO group peptidase (beta-lactamase class C family)
MRTVVIIIVLVAFFSSASLSRRTSSVAPSRDVQTALARMDTYIREAMAKTKVPGLAVAVVYQDKVVFLKGYGVRKIGDAAAVDADTVFELASVSKPISSTILASLVSTDDVSWDDLIVNLDPGFALSVEAATRQVTIRDMFAHRSGLPTGAGDVLEDLGYSRPQILSRLRVVPLAGEFRTTYHYSNFGMTEGAIAAAKKVGKRWEDIADERLYSKIGMRSTSSRFSDYENAPNKAALHVLENGIYKNRFVRDADAEAPAGGVSSSVRDLAQWIRLQLGNGSVDGRQVIPSAVLAETHKPQICRSVPGPIAAGQCPQGEFYGLGWNVSTNAQGKPQLSHSGAFLLGAGTSVYLIPDEQVGIVALGNAAPIGLPEAVCLTFLDLFHYGAAQKDYLSLVAAGFAEFAAETQDSSPDYAKIQPPQKPAPAKPFAAYTGKYFNPYYGTVEIGAEGKQLILRLPPRGAYYELTHWDGDTFTYYFASENTGTRRRGVKFSGDGKQVLIQNLAIIGNSGVFTRSE